MSNMQPVIPRFYCDWVNWLINQGRMATTDITISGLSMATGYSVIEMFDMKPSNLQTITASGVATQCIIEIDTNITGGSVQDINFIGILGHNFLEADVKWSLQQAGTGWTNSSTVVLKDVVNMGSMASEIWTADNNGWSLATFTPAASDNKEFRIVIDPAVGPNYAADIQIGVIIFGKYVDAPHRPDVSLQLGLSHNNKITETGGGARYSNQKWASASNWFLSPYEVGTATTPTLITRSGRYSHDWTFSFLADSDLIPSDFQTSTNLLTGSTMLNILEYTQGPHFPCLIQLDNTTADEYLFARLYQQGEPVSSSPNTWSIKLNVSEEV